MARFLIILGIALLALGLLWPLLHKSGVGRLPGDIIIHRDNFHFYFPLTTSILISILISLLIWLFRK